MMKYRKNLMIMILIIMFIFSSVAAIAAEEPGVYKETITVTEEGGKYEIGFVDVEFRKDFLDSEMLPVTFDVEIYAENGKSYIEFSPDVKKFLKKIHIRVDRYNGLLYDKEVEENIAVSIRKNHLVVSHFSRYCLNR